MPRSLDRIGLVIAWAIVAFSAVYVAAQWIGVLT